MTPREGLGSVVVIGRMDTCALMWCAPLLCRTLIAGPHVLAAVARPCPARATAVIPPTAVPQVAAEPKRAVATASMSRRDVCGGAIANHQGASGQLARND